MKITKEDVLEVANQLGFKPTEEQINEVIEMYPSEQRADPSGTWNLVVEHCLYSIGVEQKPKKTEKVAKLVRVSLMTRVIVDADATEKQILELCQGKFIEKIDTELSDNLEEIVEDTECPYDPNFD